MTSASLSSAVGQNIQTPPFRPARPTSSSSTTPTTTTTTTAWTTACHFSIPTFLHLLKDLTLHPERNSSLILRADPLPLPEQSQVPSPSVSHGTRDQDDDPDPAEVELDRWIAEQALEKVDEVRVRLMPKQPNRDRKLDQRVLFYRTPERIEHAHPPHTVNSTEVDSEEAMQKGKERERERAVVIMIPLVKAVEDVPFFHPPVRKVIFTYESCVHTEADGLEQLDQLDITREASTVVQDLKEDYPLQGQLSISYQPFDSMPTLTTPTPAVSDAASPSPFAGVRRTSLPRKRSPLAPSTSTPAETATATAPKEDPKVVNARLDRTCLALLERVYKHGFGQMVGYKKRVNHDVRFPFYRPGGLQADMNNLDGGQAGTIPGPLPRAEGTAPSSRLPSPESRGKFEAGRCQAARVQGESGVSANRGDCTSSSSGVTPRQAASLPHDPLSSTLRNDLSEWGSQDVAIAAFLMLLWKDMYPARQSPTQEGGEGEEWDTWGRPENGFIDLGCVSGSRHPRLSLYSLMGCLGKRSLGPHTRV